MSSQTDIRPFRAGMPDEAIADLEQRVATTRWPCRELVADRSQGVQLATITELARYWAAEYDWRRCEAKLNALPQFKTEIDGVDVHFIHARSPHADPLPLIITHGWPGSIIELLGIVGPLTDPTVHGGRAEDAFDLVIPSLPGYGFSSEAPDGLLGIHMNLLLAGLGGGYPSANPSAAERAALDAIATFRTSGNGYLIEQNTRPQTIGYALLASPIALAAWMLDHDTDSYYKISPGESHRQPSQARA
jgi:Epoxide hydrolase N terminus